MLVPVILSGGVGARLWPVSRETHPKPFMPLADGQSLIQKTFQRVAGLEGVDHIVTVTNQQHYFQTLDEFCALGLAQLLRLEFLLEPFGRNTAPAIAMAAFYVAENFGVDATLLVLPADHVIDKQDVFECAVFQAQELAAQGYLVTFGLKPLQPDTGFGYIEVGTTLAGVTPCDGLTTNMVHSFAEKPPLDVAEQYVESGNYLWNAGIFCFTAATFLAALQQHAPDIYAGCETCWQSSATQCGALRIDGESFSIIPNISIDYAVMEKAANVAVVGCDMGWSDVGSWAAMSDMLAADNAGNRVDGEAILVDSHDSYIRADDRVIAAVGIKNLIIVDTPDALLVVDKHHVQNVKQVVQRLKQSGHPCYKTHSTVHRPWGTYTELEHGERFKIKRIVVKPGSSLSLQMHYHRSEHWVVVSGTARIVNGDKDLLLHTNESTFIPSGRKHRLENPGKVALIMIEVQSGEYLEEDDIVRFDDNYGRQEDVPS